MAGFLYADEARVTKRERRWGTVVAILLVGGAVVYRCARGEFLAAGIEGGVMAMMVLLPLHRVPGLRLLILLLLFFGGKGLASVDPRSGLGRMGSTLFVTGFGASLLSPLVFRPAWFDGFWRSAPSHDADAV